MLSRMLKSKRTESFCVNLCCCADQCFNRSRNATESRLSREDSEALKEIKSVYEGHCKKLQIAPKPKVYKAIKRGIKKMRKRQKKSLKQQGSPRSRMYPFRKQRSRPMFLPSQNSRTSEDLDIHSMTSETDASFLTTSSTMTTSTVSSVVNVGGQVHNIPIDAAMLEMKSMDINDEDLIAICAALKSKEHMFRWAALILSRNSISDRGVRALADFIDSHPPVQLVDLSHNQITHTGSKVLQSVVWNRPQCVVNLQNNKMQQDIQFSSILQRLQASHREEQTRTKESQELSGYTRSDEVGNEEDDGAKGDQNSTPGQSANNRASVSSPSGSGRGIYDEMDMISPIPRVRMVRGMSLNEVGVEQPSVILEHGVLSSIKTPKVKGIGGGRFHSFDLSRIEGLSQSESSLSLDKLPNHHDNSFPVPTLPLRKVRSSSQSSKTKSTPRSAKSSTPRSGRTSTPRSARLTSPQSSARSRAAQSPRRRLKSPRDSDIKSEAPSSARSRRLSTPRKKKSGTPRTNQRESPRNKRNPEAESKPESVPEKELLAEVRIHDEPTITKEDMGDKTVEVSDDEPLGDSLKLLTEEQSRDTKTPSKLSNSDLEELDRERKEYLERTIELDKTVIEQAEADTTDSSSVLPFDQVPEYSATGNDSAPRLPKRRFQYQSCFSDPPLEELDVKEEVESLRASHNSISNIVFLPRTIVQLDLSFNRLQSLSALEGLHELKFLNVSGNFLESLDGLQNCAKLEILMLAANSLADLGSLEYMRQLRVLDISYNHIRSTQRLRFLSINTKLESLNVVGNPFMARMRKQYKMDGKQKRDKASVDRLVERNLRLFLRNIVPGLQYLNGNRVSRVPIRQKPYQPQPLSSRSKLLYQTAEKETQQDDRKRQCKRLRTPSARKSSSAMMNTKKWSHLQSDMTPFALYSPRMLRNEVGRAIHDELIKESQRTDAILALDSLGDDGDNEDEYMLRHMQSRSVLASSRDLSRTLAIREAEDPVALFDEFLSTQAVVEDSYVTSVTELEEIMSVIEGLEHFVDSLYESHVHERSGLKGWHHEDQQENSDNEEEGEDEDKDQSARLRKIALIHGALQRTIKEQPVALLIQHGCRIMPTVEQSQLLASVFKTLEDDFNASLTSLVHASQNILDQVSHEEMDNLKTVCEECGLFDPLSDQSMLTSMIDQLDLESIDHGPTVFRVLEKFMSLLSNCKDKLQFLMDGYLNQLHPELSPPPPPPLSPPPPPPPSSSSQLSDEEF